MEEVVQGLLIVIVPILLSGGTSYLITHRYEKKRDKNQIREKIANQLVLSWTCFDEVVHMFLSDPNKINKTSNKLTKNINTVKGLFRIYAKNSSDIDALEVELSKVFFWHNDMIRISLSQSDGKLPYDEYLKLEIIEAHTVFLSLLDLIGNFKLK